ncbi:DUF6582 domain-containing protein [Dactylosporangium sp. NPDC049742]|uniref:DUF6582 domain-containing protein n=1 Tax=Dactylosporangium sp. NPDC049742 TaxID=3154737 RepID=UPI003413ED1D
MAARRQSKNELDAGDRNAMPDSAYAFPRQRKEPLNDASHVRNAIARFDQVRDATDAERAEAFKRIKRAAKRHGVDMTETRWQELGKPSATMRSSDKPRAGAARGNQSRASTASGNQSRAGAASGNQSRAGAASGNQSRDELYAEAKRRDVKGRSSMNKSQLERALSGS